MKYLLLFGLILILTISPGLVSSETTALCSNPSECLELARLNYQEGKLQKAKLILETTLNQKLTPESEIIVLINLALIQQELGNHSQGSQAINQGQTLLKFVQYEQLQRQLYAQLLDVKGQLAISLGQDVEALAIWREAAKIYTETNNLMGLVNNQLYQVQALTSLGLYREAYQNLTGLTAELNNYPTTPEKAKALASLGDILRRIGRYQEAEIQLQESLELSQALGLTELVSLNLINLGKLNQHSNNYDQAWQYYQQARESAPNLELNIRAAINQLAIRQEEWAKSQPLINEIAAKIQQLPQQIATIHLRINFAEELLQMQSESQNNDLIIAQLTTAIKLAQTLGYTRGEAEGMGRLGLLYEQHQQFTPALTLTQNALLLSQNINATDLNYQWEWQLGRILQQQQQREQSIIAYSQGVKSLQSLRQDLVTISSDVQFSFREEVEPLYREFVDILLQPEATQQQLKQAREVIEALQLAELDNFFRDACLDVQPVQIDELDPNAGIIYTIFLENRLGVILAIGNQPLSYYEVAIDKSEIIKQLNWLNIALQNPQREVRSQLLRQPYDWLIKPIESQLETHHLDTLVFILDGELRNLPPGVFFDGEQYLIEKYNVAIAPSLELIDFQETSLQDRFLLLAGLTEERQGFSELPGVAQEIARIRDTTTGSVLLNADFTKGQFNQNMQQNPYTIVHLATHGRFSSRLEETFLLTWDDRLGINDLTTLLSSDQKQLQPVELLVLSACQTAVGDNRATLGLAGLAVRVGVRSTIASLWEVSDESTSLLMQQFYDQLINQGYSKAKALRNAQINLLQQQRYHHPYYWSGFILLGNWL
ncbi:MAG: CHAT domain-containing protein [Gloeocapsa sp. DLM2.Bin57]|nr:MAG: CHAT domain-containing protein [Gloeocapsa sp. DLM2.Bin57]